MKKTIVLVVAVFLVGIFESKSQLRIAGGINVLSTPFFENVPKYRLGAEINYFMQSSFALTGGLELIEKDLGASAGVRYYPINPVFLRMRGILSENTELALGMGYAIKLNKNMRVETMADYFAVNNDFAIRLGLGVNLN
ncbi:MAG: hypothetical protein RIC03_03040 [Cyclobacteriaceae bacterium]